MFLLLTKRIVSISLRILSAIEKTEEEMEQINALDRGEKHDWY